MTQLLVTVENTSALSNLRIAIRQMKGVTSVSTLKKAGSQLLTQVGGKNHKMMPQRINELQSLLDGWDGCLSRIVSPVCIKAIKDFLEIVPDRLLTNWVMFPDSRGYLYLDYTSTSGVAGITQKPDGILYFIQKGGLVEKSSHEELTSSEVLHVIKRVYEA